MTFYTFHQRAEMWSVLAQANNNGITWKENVFSHLFTEAPWFLVLNRLHQTQYFVYAVVLKFSRLTLQTV